MWQDRLVSPDNWGDKGSIDWYHNFILNEVAKKLDQTSLKCEWKGLSTDARYYLQRQYLGEGEGWCVRFWLLSPKGGVLWLNPDSRGDLLRIMAWLISEHCFTRYGNTVNGWETVTKYAPL